MAVEGLTGIIGGQADMATQEQTLRVAGGWIDSLSRLASASKKHVEVCLAIGIGLAIWYMPPPASLNTTAMHFLATLAGAVALWICGTFEEYVVALLLLLSWLVLNLVPTDIALGGFAKPSWLFVLGTLGVGAAIGNSGLVNRLASRILANPNYDHRRCKYLLTAVGVLITPVLPRGMARVLVVAPLSQTISKKLKHEPRSNASASLALSAYTGATVFTFMFMTGGTYCLIGWSLLPQPARSEFGWGLWVIAALPAGIVMLMVVMVAINFLFPIAVGPQETAEECKSLPNPQPLTKQEIWVAIIIGFTITGWLTKSIHGVSESTIVFAALLLFLLTDVLDKKSFKTNVEWGFLLFFGVAYSLAVSCSYLKIDQWLMGLVNPLIGAVSYSSAVFLIFVLGLTYFMRFFLLATPTTILLLIGLTPIAVHIGIHPGVLLLTILMGAETWFLPHQYLGYLLAYNLTDGNAFSHAQGRKLMVAKFIASFIAVLVSVPYWRLIGFIQ